VKTFRDLGCSVLILSMVGKGCPDICVGFRGKNYLFEIKCGDKPLSSQKLTKMEIKFFDDWRGYVSIISSKDDVLEFIGNLI